MQWFEMQDIIRDVIDLTKDNRVKWNSYDENGFNAFFLDLGSGRMSIYRQYESMDDEYDYNFQIYNESGETIETFVTAYEDREYQHLLRELYYVAENSHLQRDATIASIKAAIGNLKSNSPF